VCDLPPITFGEKASDVGFLKQCSDDEEDWKLTNKATPSKPTGPSGDHTTGGRSGYYAYLEGSGIAIGSRVCSGLVNIISKGISPSYSRGDSSPLWIGF